MKITQNIRDYAEKHGLANDKAVLEEGMKEKSEECLKNGAEIYQKV